MSDSKLLRVTLIGRTQLLMHAWPGEQPSMQKAPPGKKTWTHIENNRKSEWLKSAYWDSEKECFYIPPANIDRMMQDGATRFRQGAGFKRNVTVYSDFVPLTNAEGEKYGAGTMVRKATEIKEGQFTKDAKVKAAGLEDFYGPDHVDIRRVVIKGSSLDRCRPCFKNWRIDFTVLFQTETIEEAWIAQSLTYNYLCDFRPRFGHFTATVAPFKE